MSASPSSVDVGSRTVNSKVPSVYNQEDRNRLQKKKHGASPRRGHGLKRTAFWIQSKKSGFNAYNFSFIIVSFSLTSAGLVHALMEKFQQPNNTFQKNFNDQIPKINFVSSDFVMGKT